MNSKKIGLFIAQLRKEKNMTQQELADKLYVTSGAISKWENGRGIPDITLIRSMANILQVTIDEILNGEREYSKKNIKEDDENKILEIKGLSKSFGKRKVLNNVNLDIYDGEIVGLIGTNGAGKSTLIKTVLNLYKSDSGLIKICGFNIKTDLTKALEKIGCIVENPDMYEDISGRKNLKITEILSKNDNDEYTKEIIKLVKLEDRIDDKVKTYSLGMKQRLGIANALIQKPKLLILDEPTNGLDPLGIIELREILKKINVEQKTTILISSHILSEVESICDKVFIIDNGKIINSFGMEKIKYKHISLEKEFLKSLKREEVDYENK